MFCHETITTHTDTHTHNLHFLMTANTSDAETHNLSALLTVQGRRGSEKLLKECPIPPGNFYATRDHLENR